MLTFRMTPRSSMSMPSGATLTSDPRYVAPSRVVIESAPTAFAPSVSIATVFKNVFRRNR
jgi:peroxiredoxin